MPTIFILQDLILIAKTVKMSVPTGANEQHSAKYSAAR
jgi:hypothetical protein